MRVLFPTFALAFVVSGCDEPGVCAGVEVGARYDVDVREVFYNHPSIPGPFCSPEQDIALGQTARFQVVGTNSIEVEIAGCIEAVAEVDEVSGVVPVPGVEPNKRSGSATAPGGQIFVGATRATIGACEGDWTFVVEGTRLAEYNIQDPQVFLERCFFPDLTSDCAALIDGQLPPINIEDQGEPNPSGECCDRFGVEVRKVEE